MSSDNINVRVRGPLRDHLQSRIGETGLYENASEYIRALIRQDYQTTQEAWQWLADELEPALIADDSEYISITAEDVIARNLSK